MNKLLPILFLLLSCVPAKRPPAPPPDQACRAACLRRDELKCESRGTMTADECTASCENVEKLRPGSTHASCAATSLDCDEMRRCR